MLENVIAFSNIGESIQKLQLQVIWRELEELKLSKMEHHN